MKLPRLGAVLLGTIIKELGWEVRVYVEEIEAIDYRDVLTADVVGISTITSTAQRAYAIADALRDYGLPVVMGGPHVTFLAEEALDHCDYVVRGEGEEALPMLLEALMSGGDLKTVPNLSHRDESGGILHNSRTGGIENLDGLPYPDFDLIVGWEQAKSFNRLPIIPIQATRGCPFGCRFCSVIGMFGRRMRFRSVEHVIGELERYRDHKAHVFFYDDNFTANRRWTKELLTEAKVRKNLFTSWSGQVRTDVARDDEMLSLMRRTDCTNVYVGFESVNPAALKEMNKKQSVEDMKRAASKFNEFGIEVHGMFVFGFDSDTKETLNETIRFAIRSGILSAQFLILTPLPGTPLTEELIADDRITVSDWSHYDAHHVVFKPNNLSTWELQYMQMKGHALFYSRRRALKQLMRGYLAGSAIYLYARRMHREWKRGNRYYLKALKLAERARGMNISFDFNSDLSEIGRQVQLAAYALAFGY